MQAVITLLSVVLAIPVSSASFDIESWRGTQEDTFAAPDILCSVRGRVTEGCITWAKVLDAGRDEFVEGWALSPSGDVLFLAGNTDDLFVWHGDAYLVALDAHTGEELWSEVYNGVDGRIDIFDDVVLSPDGSTLYVLGGSKLSDMEATAFVFAYNATSGEKKWTTFYEGPRTAHWGTIGFIGATVTSDGEFLLPGGWALADDDAWTDMVLLKMNTTTGDIVWEFTDSLPGVQLGTGAPILSNDESTLFVTSGPIIRALDFETAAELWRTQREGVGFGFKFLDEETDRVYATGHSTESIFYEGFYVFAYDAATGAEVWSKQHVFSSLTVPDDWNSLSAATFTSDGNFIVTGTRTPEALRRHWFTASIDKSDGSFLWLTEHAGLRPTGGGAAALVASPTEPVVFAGGSTYGATSDSTIVMYDEWTGAPIRELTYTGRNLSAEGARGLMITEDGKSLLFTSVTREPDEDMDILAGRFDLRAFVDVPVLNVWESLP